MNDDRSPQDSSDSTAPPDTTVSASLGPRRQVPAWSRVFVAALFVIAVAAAFSYVMSEDPEERGEAVAGAFAQQFFDNFDRSSAAELGEGQGVSWVSERGDWSIQIGVVHLSPPDPFFNAVTVDSASPDMSISAYVGGSGVCGVTARYEDPENYLALVGARGFGVWNIVEVVDGEDHVLGTVPDVASNNVTVRLDVGPDVVTAVVGLFRTELAVKVRVTGTKMGLLARGGAMESCTWDDAVGSLAA